MLCCHNLLIPFYHTDTYQVPARKCEDNDAKVKQLSKGSKLNCIAVADQCQDREIGETVRTQCPKTCGSCKRFKFIKDHLDLDNIMDFAWCELEEGDSQRCKMEAPNGKYSVRPIHGGTILSWNGCERTENKQVAFTKADEGKTIAIKNGKVEVDGLDRAVDWGQAIHKDTNASKVVSVEPKLEGNVVLGNQQAFPNPKPGNHPARINDAPAAYLDAVNDMICSCSYPRCFNGKMVSSMDIMNVKGEGVTLRGLVPKLVRVDMSYVAKKMRECCLFRTSGFIEYLQTECMEAGVESACVDTPNGFATFTIRAPRVIGISYHETYYRYEPRFGNETLGASKHFGKMPCVADAWAKYEFVKIADKRKFAIQARDKMAKASVNEDLDLQDHIAGHLMLVLAGIFRRSLHTALCHAHRSKR